MTVTGQKKISIYDPATGTVVQLNNISEEGEFEKKGSFIKTSNGGRLYSGDESKAEFLSLDWTGFDQLITWMKNRTPVRFVTYGLDEHILWYEDTLITVDQKTVFSPYKRSGFKIYFEKAGGVHSIYKGANLFFIQNNWLDSNGDNIADGYIAGSSAVPSKQFSNGLQTLTAVSNGVITFTTVSPIIYPISNIALSLSNNITANNLGNAKTQLYCQNFSTAVLLDIAAAYSVVNTMITPTNTYLILAYPIWENSAVIGQSITFKRPSLLSNNSPYVETNF